MPMNPEIVKVSALMGWKNSLHLCKRGYYRFFIRKRGGCGSNFLPPWWGDNEFHLIPHLFQVGLFIIMLSRRILRIKILQSLYAYYKAGEESVTNAEKQLFFSIRKTYDLYHYLLLLIVEIVRFLESRIELARNKKIPTFDDLHPNTRFVDNRLVKQISGNTQLKSYLKEIKLSWVNYPELIRGLSKKIDESEDYVAYMSQEDVDYEDDKKVISKIFSTMIIFSEELYQNLEEQSIFWNDDVEFAISMIIKTVKKFTEDSGPDTPLMPMYRNNDDKQFVKRLFRKAIANGDDYIALIGKYTKNWEIERIAFMDILVMQLGIAEIVEFEDIPTKVSFNEYLEISKYYSTPKSSYFINGILDKIIHELKTEKIIVKKGRGLVGEENENKNPV